MTHLQILMHELAQHGATTYKALVRTYEAHGYTYFGFTAAVCHARKLGIVAPASRGGAITAVGACPCCGREL